MSFDFEQKRVAESLANSVRECFPNPVWPIDRRASDHDDLDGTYINNAFPGKKWTEITDHELGWTGQDSWAFTNEALAFFLPAWLVSYLEEHYPGAENFGLIYFPVWVRRLSPFRNYNYSKEQVLVLRDIAKFNVDHCGADLEYCEEDVEALQLLYAELNQPQG